KIRWVDLQSEGPWFFALGVGATPNRLTLARGTWDGTLQVVSWDCEFHLVKHGFVLEPAGDQGRTVAVATIAGPPLPERVMPAGNFPFTQDCRAGMPAWLPPEARPFSLGEDSAWSAHVAAGQAILSCYDRRGILLNTLEVTRELLDEAERGPAARLCLAAWGE